MDWLDVGGWKWTAIGTVVGMLIALGSLVVSILSRKASERSASASERSARASEESADAARRAVTIQEQEHIHSQTAKLQIFDARTFMYHGVDGANQVGAPPGFRFSLRNLGGSGAFDLRSSLESGIDLLLRRHGSTLGPSEETFSVSEVDGRVALSAPKPSRATYSLSYRDRLGPHMLEAIFELEFEIGKNIPATIVSVTLDGVTQP